MPGYADWRGLYCEELVALNEEGFDVRRFAPVTDAAAGAEAHQVAAADDGDSDEWRGRYYDLWSARHHGLRADYPYREPDDLQEIYGAAAGASESICRLDPEELRDRIEGAWTGRAVGVVLGKPLEMGWDRSRIRDYLESASAYPLTDWVPARAPNGVETRVDCIPSTRGNVEYTQPDDDMHYTILALRLAEKRGLSFTHADVGRNWLENIPYHWVWCASRQAYYRMVADNALDDPDAIARIPYELNPWRECIDGQIRSDFWGYACPGEPRNAASLAHRDCSFSLVRNGVYGGMFVAAAIAQSLTPEPTLEGIIEAGLSVIPARSRLAEAAARVQTWYRETKSWEAACERIETTYGHLPFAGTINNMSVVVLALLHGNLDLERTITTAVMCGFDTDCNAGTAGSIVGAATGMAGVPSRWHTPLNGIVQSVVAEVRDTTLHELVARTLKVIDGNTR